MKIGVSGASGQLGQAVVSELLRHGGDHQIVGISRSPDSVPVPAEGRQGDYDQPETLISAYADLDRLLLIPSADLHAGVRGRQLQAAIKAAYRAGVKHVVLMSAAGTRRTTEPALGEAYWTGEQCLIRTAPTWTILRMNYYAESMAQEIHMSAGAGVLTGLGEERVAYVSRDDVAAAAAGLLLSEGHAGAIYNATGPETISGTERAAIASQVLGKALSFAVIGTEDLRVGLNQANLPKVIVQAMIDIKSTFVRGDFDVLTTDVERLSGRKPKAFGDVLGAALAEGVQA